MKKLKVAINGFGRIGRIFFRQALAPRPGSGQARDDIEIVAINDLGAPENLAYLLKYDSVYGRFQGGPVKADISQSGTTSNGEGARLIVGKKEIPVYQEKDPAKLPWGELGVDIVVEATGVFRTYEKSKPHLDAGAKRVVITAPAKDAGTTQTFTPNVGVQFASAGAITSNASCTTNATTPVMAVMMQNPGVAKALLTTVHGYTASQRLVDGPSDDIRRGRAGAVNIVPSHTGAAVATQKAIPDIENKFDGVAMRVPVPSGSLLDFTFLAKRKTSVDEINEIFREAAGKPEWEGILAVTDEPLVSSDILRQPYGSIVDTSFTRVVDGDLVKIFSWYDNEWGYCAMLVKHVETVGAHI